MFDIFLEVVVALVIATITLYMIYMGRKKDLPKEGWSLIVAGLCLLLFGSLIDITDNFESLNRFIVIGDTPTQAFLEKVVGNLLGFILLSGGLVIWVPKIASVDKVMAAYNELAHAEAEIAELAELMPICASCKNVREDTGYWTSVESYMKEHTGSDFSHTICPECVKKLYPETHKKIQERHDAIPDDHANKNI